MIERGTSDHLGRRCARGCWAVVWALAAMAALLPAPASATHERATLITWAPTSGNAVEFTITGAWRRSAYSTANGRCRDVTDTVSPVLQSKPCTRRRWLRRRRRRDRRVARRDAVQPRTGIDSSPRRSARCSTSSRRSTRSTTGCTPRRSIPPACRRSTPPSPRPTRDVDAADGVHPGLLPGVERSRRQSSTSTIRTATTASRPGSRPAPAIGRRSAPCRRSCCARATALCSFQIPASDPGRRHDHLPPLHLHRGERLVDWLHPAGPDRCAQRGDDQQQRRVHVEHHRRAPSAARARPTTRPR